MEKNKKETYSFIKYLSLYYWHEAKRFFSTGNAWSNLMMTQKELNEARASKEIKDYDNICYRKGWVEWCLNLLNEDSILKPSDNPILDDDIKYLIDNVAWYKENNIDYLHRAILYKYHNINDVHVPCIVFAGKWGSWKWTFISLLWTIFWEENVMCNLGQRELTSSFDAYKWMKLVVEYAEVTSNNTQGDKKILNKLKNIIGASKIIVNEKWVAQYEIENLAWFFISSNSNKPLQLDDRDKGNRRFSIILSEHKLENWKRINKSVRVKEKVENYLSWLYQTYPDILEYSELEALENQDKFDLEQRSQEEANSFWDFIEERYPNFKWKKTLAEVNELMTMYCIENSVDEREFLRFFWHNSKFSKKKIRIWEKTYMWVEI